MEFGPIGPGTKGNRNLDHRMGIFNFTPALLVPLELEWKRPPVIIYYYLQVLFGSCAFGRRPVIEFLLKGRNAEDQIVTRER